MLHLGVEFGADEDHRRREPDPDHESDDCPKRAIGLVIAAKVRGVPREQDRYRDPCDSGESAAPAHPSPLRFPAAWTKSVKDREPEGDDNKEDRPATDLHDQCSRAMQLIGRKNR